MDDSIIGISYTNAIFKTRNCNTLLSPSHLYIEGKLLTSENKYSATLRFIDNGIAFLSDEIRYEVGGYINDSNRNVGITSLMTTLNSYSPNEMTRWKNAGWDIEGTPLIMDDEGDFGVCLPLRLLLGFCVNFIKNIVNTRQELILIRSNTDIDAIMNSNYQEVTKVELNKIIWKVPHISLSDSHKLKFL